MTNKHYGRKKRVGERKLVKWKSIMEGRREGESIVERRTGRIIRKKSGE